MIRSTDDLEIPNNGASCRIVKLVCQYAVTSKMRSSSDRLHGRPRCGSVVCSRRIAVTDSLKRRGLSPVKGAIQDGADAVITPATP